jgi:hypothetical protein
MAAAVFAAAGPPATLARALTAIAVDAGGHDNIAVAVLPFPPTDAEPVILEPVDPEEEN